MTLTSRREAVYRESAAYGGLVDAVGGVATIVLAVVGLVGIHAPLMTAIATIVFGIALLIQGGTMLSEYASIIFPAGVRAIPIDQFGGSSLTSVFLVGATGIVLGVLALLGINAGVLLPVAVIAFGTALVLSSNAVWHLYVLRRASVRADSTIQQSSVTASPAEAREAGGELLASEMASGSAGIQALAGLAAVVLGIIAVAGSPADLTLNLCALLALGATLILTGGSLSATVMGLMRPWQQR
ncbi:hypothetical protein [Methylocystis heyeri]|uniref:Uncharacterized protein n=1 Tax=Methylocystis heyeri TaxID=391905 RepID=A0A6B8KDP6_9HYPH|nr:hypothetical protein [Methylocystis heyeri]QGM45797.1 hypothetical protein H2LOC_008825 [Methylocystis heyeri]